MLNKIPNLHHLDSGNFFLMAGPCVVESPEMCLNIARKVKDITDRLSIPYIFKASYRKANRTRLDSFTGIGDQEALDVLAMVKKEVGVPIVTDIHESHEAAFAAQVADVLQIPAFLCRQTDLLVAAGKTGKTVNIKKGQFLSADAMKFAVTKVRETGNELVMLTERGSMFGYQDLIVDYRSIPAMKMNKVPVVMDITHSLQQPNQSTGVTGGKPELIELIAKAGIAAGADGIFVETHPDPQHALSDGANMLHLDNLEVMLRKLINIQKAIQNS
ncbi:MAG: 3-deoxy-8-phosphooctulonate synthase [Bacteroidia bacterium]